MDILKEGHVYIKSLAGVENLSIEVCLERPSEVVSAIVETPGGHVEVNVSLKGALDLDVEEKRLLRELEKLSAELKTVGSRLSNEGFLLKAPGDVVIKEKERLSGLALKKDKLDVSVERIKAIRGA
ncbi:MAG: hypothetical protein HY880_06030 [Deltaproteobacteria bacterium]|nr:hypothetical protein [Deltaproteobacteria bacterium]